MIVGVDGTNWIHALWHTVGANAPQLAADRLRAVCDHLRDKLALEYTPGQTFHVVVCWDRPSFRHELASDYKAGRKEKDSTLVKSLEAGPKALDVEGLSLGVDGYEADDLLASLAAAAVATQQQCVLCSGDKDLYQCLRNGRVSILRNFKTERLRIDTVEHIRLYEPQWVTEATLTMETGLRPDQWIDYQCLVGESGDNVQGCDGWGPKYAAELLAKCGSIEQAFDLLDRSSASYNPHRLPGVPKTKTIKLPTRYQKLAAWREQYPATRQLIELRADVLDVWDCLR
jgi:5'-3' exonuclease